MQLLLCQVKEKAKKKKKKNPNQTNNYGAITKHVNTYPFCRAMHIHRTKYRSIHIQPGTLVRNYLLMESEKKLKKHDRETELQQNRRGKTSKTSGLWGFDLRWPTDATASHNTYEYTTTKRNQPLKLPLTTCVHTIDAVLVVSSQVATSWLVVGTDETPMLYVVEWTPAAMFVPFVN